MKKLLGVLMVILLTLLLTVSFVLADDLIIEGAAGSSPGSWGQAVAMDTTRGSGIVEPGWFAPGSVITVIYEGEGVPEIVFQSWSGGPVGWAKVAPYTVEDGIALFAYDDIVEAFGTDDFDSFFDKFYVGDTGDPLTVLQVSIGTPGAETGVIVIEGAAGSTQGPWGQAVAMDTTRGSGIVDPAWFAPGTVVTVSYESDNEPEIVFQSWTDGKPDSAGWAKIAPYFAQDGLALFAYDDIVAAFGTDDFGSFLDKFYVGDTGAPLTVFEVAVGPAQ